MKTNLFIAGIIGILTMISPPAMASGPGRNDHDVPSALFQPSDQSGIIKIHDNDSWNNGSDNSWPYNNQPFPWLGFGWNGNSYYGAPYWGNPYGNSYYHKPKRLTERQVVRAVKNQHFHHVDKVWFDDGVYKVRAIDYYGRRVLLLVDPYDGRILRWSFRR